MVRQPFASVLTQARVTASRGVPDADLLERFLQTRDEAAFAALVRRHRPAVLAACRQVLTDDAEIEDTVQQTFLTLWRTARTIRNRPSVGAWLFGVAHRLAVTALTRSRRRRVVEGQAGARRTQSADPPDLSWREACAILHEELDRLAAKHRLPLLLCYLDGKTRDEAARQLGWTVGAVKGHLERGRVRLRDRLARRGVTLSAGLLAAATGANATAGPTLPAAAILRAVLSEVPRRVPAVLRGVGSARRLVILAAAVTLGTAGIGARLATGDHDGPPAAPPPPQAPAAVVAPAPTETMPVRGRVLDPDGRPVAGARVFTFRQTWEGVDRETADGEIERATTDADGRFRFDAPKLALFHEGKASVPIPVMAGADGFGFGWEKPSASGDEITIKLVRDQPITGRVVDTEGRPVAAAEVRVYEVLVPRTGRIEPFINAWTASWHDAYGATDFGLNQPPQGLVHVTPTDRDGRFRVTGAGAERVVKLYVRGPGIAKSLVTVLNRASFDAAPVNKAAIEREPPRMRIPGQPPELYGPAFDFVPQPVQPVEGTVREAGTGRPVAGVRVFASGRYGNDVEAYTDAAGRFRLEGLAKVGTSTLFHVQPPAKSSYLHRNISVPNPDGLQPLTLNAELTRGVVLTGRVVDKASGRGVFADLSYGPLPDNPYFGKPAYDPDRQHHYGCSTEPDGRFHLTVIPGPGVFAVRTHGDEILDRRQLSPYMPGELSAEDRKRVTVRDQGGGQYNLAFADGSIRPVSGNILKVLDLPEGAEPVTLDLPLNRGRTASLRVFDADGQPLPGAVVAGLTGMWPITYTIPTAENTVYALDPAKPRKLVIYHPDKNLAGTATVRGDETGPVMVPLTAAAAVTGRILDADGKPVAGVDLNLTQEGNSAREMARYLAPRRGPARTATDGRFKITGLVPDLRMSFNLRKGTTNLLLEQPERPPRPQLEAGQTLDLGDLRTKPRAD